jgi:hypothetical protein
MIKFDLKLMKKQSEAFTWEFFWVRTLNQIYLDV